MKVYVVKHGDENEYDIVGIFSNEEQADKFVELAKQEDDRVFAYHEYDVDELLPSIAKLEDLNLYKLHIYYLSDYGSALVEDKVWWHGWHCSQASIDTALEYKGDQSHEFTTDNKWWHRGAVIKAHTPEEAISIAEKIMVRL